MFSVKKINLGSFCVSWIPIEEGKRIYYSSSAKKEAEKEMIPLKGRIDPIGNGDWVLSIRKRDDENYFFSSASYEITTGISLAERQVQDCGMFRTSRGEVIFYYKEKNLPVICKKPYIDYYKYFLYRNGTFMDISERTLNSLLSCPDIVWITQCNIKNRISEEDVKIYWLPIGDEKRLYISNLFSSDLEDIPTVGIIREIEGGDYVIYPLEGKEKYSFPYKYYQYCYVSSLLSSTQLPGEGYGIIKLGGKYGLLNKELFISPHPLVVLETEDKGSKYILFKGKSTDFYPEVFKIISENPSLLDDRTLYTIMERPDVLLHVEDKNR